MHLSSILVVFCKALEIILVSCFLTPGKIQITALHLILLSVQFSTAYLACGNLQQ